MNLTIFFINLIIHHQHECVERKDAFAKSSAGKNQAKTAAATTTSFKDAMKDVDMDREKKELLRKIALKEKEELRNDHDLAVVGDDRSPVSLKRGT
jgi:hypothetical protein